MTVQTQATPVLAPVQGVRGLKKFAIGIAALAAAGTGIGLAVSATSSEAPATVIAPVSEPNPNTEQRDAYQRLQERTANAEPEVVFFQPGKPGIK